VPPFWFSNQCDYKREADTVPPGGALSYIHSELVEESLPSLGTTETLRQAQGDTFGGLILLQARLHLTMFTMNGVLASKGSYLNEHWKLTLLIWLTTLCFPLDHAVFPGATEARWLFVGELYWGEVFVVFPFVFNKAFWGAMPWSLLFVCFHSGHLLIHIFLCSWVAHLLAARSLIKRQFGRLI
jgi:hypothetical protein